MAVFGCSHCTVSFQVFGSYAKLNFVQRVSARSNFSNALRLANTFSWDCNVHLLAFRPLTIFFFENHNCNMLLSFFNWDLRRHFAWKCVFIIIFSILTREFEFVETSPGFATFLEKNFWASAMSTYSRFFSWNHNVHLLTRLLSFNDFFWTLWIYLRFGLRKQSEQKTWKLTVWCTRK